MFSKSDAKALRATYFIEDHSNTIGPTVPLAESMFLQEIWGELRFNKNTLAFIVALSSLSFMLSLLPNWL